MVRGVVRRVFLGKGIGVGLWRMNFVEINGLGMEGLFRLRCCRLGKDLVAGTCLLFLERRELVVQVFDFFVSCLQASEFFRELCMKNMVWKYCRGISLEWKQQVWWRGGGRGLVMGIILRVLVRGSILVLVYNVILNGFQFLFGFMYEVEVGVDFGW